MDQYFLGLSAGGPYRDEKKIDSLKKELEQAKMYQHIILGLSSSYYLHEFIYFSKNPNEFTEYIKRISTNMPTLSQRQQDHKNVAEMNELLDYLILNDVKGIMYVYNKNSIL